MRITVKGAVFKVVRSALQPLIEAGNLAFLITRCTGHSTRISTIDDLRIGRYQVIDLKGLGDRGSNKPVGGGDDDGDVASISVLLYLCNTFFCHHRNDVFLHKLFVQRR